MFIRRIATGLALCLGISTIAVPASSAATESRYTAQQAVDRNATLKVAQPAVVLTLDPHLARDISQVGLFYDTLFTVDKDRNIKPGLAISFVVSGKTIVMKLRRDARFSDGSTVDAEAVKESLDRARTLPTATTRAALSAIDFVTVVDDFTVRLSFTYLDNTLQYALAEQAGVVINPKRIDGDLSKVPAGSTPYDVAEFQPGVKLAAERRSKGTYWDANAWPVKRIEVIANSNPNSIISGLKTGAFNMGIVANGYDQPKAQKQLGGNFTYNNLGGDSAYNLLFRSTRGDIKDVAVRQAILRGFDRKTFANKVAVNCDYAPQLAVQGSAAYIKGYDPYAYDPAAARKVLAGKKYSIEVLMSPQLITSSQAAQVMKQQLGDLGVSVTITGLSVTEFIPRFYSGTRDSAIIPQSARADFANTINDQVLGAANLGGTDYTLALKNRISKVNALALGSPARASALQGLAKYTADLALTFPVCRPSNLWITTKAVKNVNTMPYQWAGVFYLRNVAVTK